MIQGCLIGESLRVGVPLDLPPDVHVERIARKDVSVTAAPGQRPVWTVIDFRAECGDGQELAETLAATLEADGGWYADFRSGDEHVVVFAGKIFRYQRGDAVGRAEAESYGRSVGVPEHELDWVD